MLAFFGLDIKTSGVMSGDQLAKQGGKHAICVIQAQGVDVLEKLGDGAEQAFSSAVRSR